MTASPTSPPRTGKDETQPLQPAEMSRLVNQSLSTALNRKGRWLKTEDLPDDQKVAISVLLLDAFGVASSGDGALDRQLFYWITYGLSRLPDNLLHAGTGLPHGLTILSPMIADAVANSQFATNSIRRKAERLKRNADRRLEQGKQPRRRLVEIVMQSERGIRLVNNATRTWNRFLTTPGRFVTGAAGILAVWPLAVPFYPLIVPLFQQMGMAGLVGATGHLISAATVGTMRAVMPHSPLMDKVFHGVLWVVSRPFAWDARLLKPYFYKEKHGLKSLGRRERASLLAENDWLLRARPDIGTEALMDVSVSEVYNADLSMQLLFAHPLTFASRALRNRQENAGRLKKQAALLKLQLRRMNETGIVPTSHRIDRSGTQPVSYYESVLGDVPELFEAEEPESNRRGPANKQLRWLQDLLVGPAHLSNAKVSEILTSVVGPQPDKSDPLQRSWNGLYATFKKQLRHTSDGLSPLGEDASAAAIGKGIADYFAAAIQNGQWVNLSLDALPERTVGRYVAEFLEHRQHVPRFVGAPVVLGDANSIAKWRLGEQATMQARNDLALELVDSAQWNDRFHITTQSGDVWNVPESAFEGRPKGIFKPGEATKTSYSHPRRDGSREPYELWKARRRAEHGVVQGGPAISIVPSMQPNGGRRVSSRPVARPHHYTPGAEPVLGGNQAAFRSAVGASHSHGASTTPVDPRQLRIDQARGCAEGRNHNAGSGQREAIIASGAEAALDVNDGQTFRYLIGHLPDHRAEAARSAYSSGDMQGAQQHLREQFGSSSVASTRSGLNRH